MEDKEKYLNMDIIDFKKHLVANRLALYYYIDDKLYNKIIDSLTLEDNTVVGDKNGIVFKDKNKKEYRYNLRVKDRFLKSIMINFKTEKYESTIPD